jgi:hypothetical protein
MFRMAIATRRRAGRPSDHPGHPASACWSCATGIWPSSASQPSRSARARETPRADRPDRAATHRRRLPIRQVQHLGQHERRPPIRVQPPHQPPNTPLSRVHGRLGLREPGSRRLTAEQAAQPPSRNRIRARPPSDHQQPRPGACVAAKRRQCPPRPQKDLLGDVLGLVTIDQMGAHPPHLRLATPDERPPRPNGHHHGQPATTGSAHPSHRFSRCSVFRRTREGIARPTSRRTRASRTTAPPGACTRR